MVRATYTGFKEILKSIDDFVLYLESKGISLNAQSRFAIAIEHSHQVVRAWENKVISPGFNIHHFIGDLANVWWLSSIIMRARNTTLEAELINKLALLTKADPLPLTPGSRSYERDILFEVILACVCSQFAMDVHFVEPPDVVCTYKKVQWGLACKVAYGSSRQTAKDIRKGIGQIERSDVDLGIVVVQMTNRFPHKNMYKIDQLTGDIISYHDEEIQNNLFTRLLFPLTREIEKETVTHLKNYPRILNHRVRGIVFVANTIAYFRGKRAIMGRTYFSKLSRLQKMPEEDFVNLLNEWWQKT